MNLPAGGFQPLLDTNAPGVFGVSQSQGGQGYVPPSISIDPNNAIGVNNQYTGLPNIGQGNQPQQGGFFSKGGGYQNIMGGLNALSGVAGAYTGLQQFGLAKDAFAYNKDLTNTNLANQATTTNSAQFDRLQRQNAAQGVTGKYQSLAEYTANSDAAVSGKIGG